MIQELYNRVKTRLVGGRERTVISPEMETKLENKTRWRKQYESGDISKEELRELYEQHDYGWFECDQCSWHGPFCPADFTDDGEEITMKLQCPECKAVLEEL